MLDVLRKGLVRNKKGVFVFGRHFLVKQTTHKYEHFCTFP